jgi:hypothetical protein
VKLVDHSYCRDPLKLLRLSGVGHLFDTQLKTNLALESNWAVVKDWSEESRYDATTVEILARDMYDAVTAPANGVLPWLKNRW